MSARTSAGAGRWYSPAQEPGDPVRLRLGQGHRRAQRLQQRQEEHVVDLGMEHPAVQRQVVVGGRDQVLVEEREGDLVAGAVDDEVDVLLDRAIGEAHRRALERRDVRLGHDLAVGHAREDVVGDRRVGLADEVVGLGQPERRRAADHALDQLVHPALAQREGDARVDRELVRRLAEEVVGDDPGPAPCGQAASARSPARPRPRCPWPSSPCPAPRPSCPRSPACRRTRASASGARRRYRRRGTRARASAGPNGGRWPRRRRRNGASRPSTAPPPTRRRARARPAPPRSRT